MQARRQPTGGLLRRLQILLDRHGRCLRLLPALRLLRRSLPREDFLKILHAFASGLWPQHPNTAGLDLAGDGPPTGAAPDLYLLPRGENWEVHVPTANRDPLPPSLTAALERRDCLLRRLGEWLIAHQGEFLRRGPEFLSPRTRRQLAEELDLASSTVSRALRHKYLQTPAGTWPLADLLSRRGEPPPPLLRSQLAQLLREDPEALLWSDRRCAEILSQRHGIRLSRRRIGPLRRRNA